MGGARAAVGEVKKPKLRDSIEVSREVLRV